MKPILFYLLQVIAASGLLYGYYHFALRNKKFHRYNRFYLLMAAMGSILIPFLNIPVYFTAAETESSVMLQTLRVISSPVTSTPETDPIIIDSTASSQFSFTYLLYTFYFLACLLFIIRVTFSINKIRLLIKNHTIEPFDKIKFVNTDEPGTPFSFFRWLFWNRKIELHSEKGEQIFRHELFHIQQKHTWDILFIELLTVVFWINPFFQLIKKEIKAIHEFLADEFAIKENNNWQYAELLLMQVLNTNNQLVNPFFHNQIKRRIAMITTSQKPSYRYIRKLMVLPVAAIIIFLFAFTYNNRQIDPHEFEKAINSITVVIDAGHGGTDKGARIKDGKLNEAELCLTIAKKIEALAHDYNVNVIMTREDEKFPYEATNRNDALRKRVESVNNLKPYALISLHMNTTSDNQQNDRSGFDGYITNKGYQIPDIQLASSVLAELRKVYTTNQNIKQRGNASIYVLDKSNSPSFLLECGYLNNPKDISFVTNENNQEKIAKAILKGIVTFANNMTPDQMVDRERVVADTRKQLGNALIIINGVVQKKRGIQNLDTTIFPNKEFKGSAVYVFGGKEAIDKYGEKGKDGVVEFFFDQNSNQMVDTIPKVDTIYSIKELPAPAKKSPTQAQLDSWRDSKMYGVWIDGKRITNNELIKFKPSDFAFYYNSKLAKTAINYGKHYYQIDLYTPKDYDRSYGTGTPRTSVLVKEVILDSDTAKPTQPLLVINDKPMPGLKISELDKIMLSPNDIESMSILKGQQAIDKYGDKAKDGVIEIKSKQFLIGFKDETIKKVTVNEKAVQDDDNKVFEKVQVESAFPGGVTEWRKYLEGNIDANVPVKNGAKSGTYTVIVQFIVDKDGRVSDVRALTNHGFGMEEEAMRMIRKGPDWIPAIQNGHIVKAYRKQPITFVVVEDTKNEPLSSNNFDPSPMNFNDPEFKKKWREMISEIKAIAWKEGKAAYTYKGRTYVFGRIINPDPTVASFTEQNGTDHVFLLDGDLINSVDDLNKLIKRSDVKKIGFMKQEEALSRFNRKDAIVFIETSNEVITKN